MTRSTGTPGTRGLAGGRIAFDRTWLVAIGILCIMIGFGTVVLAAGPDVTEGVIIAIGIVLVILCVPLFLGWVVNRNAETLSPAHHRREGIELTGADFEESIQRLEINDPDLVPVVKSNIKGRLRHVAVDALVANRGLDREEAISQLDTASWTDDSVAGAFLQSTAVDENSGFRDLSYETKVQQTVAELADLETSTSTDPGWLPIDLEAEWGAQWPKHTAATTNWQGLGAFALFTLGLAAFFESASLLLVGGLFVGMAGYTRATTVPDPTLAVEHRFETATPKPGEPVTVDVTVTNDGDDILPDVRLIDVVPPRLAVVDGSPRHATALAPGETVTFSYDVLAVYGNHEFDTLQVASRDLSGRLETTTTIDCEKDVLSCEPGVIQESVPLHPVTSGVTGRVTSDTGGSGQEFRSVREYRHGDSLRRVDWNRMARTGELATLEFREEHAASVVILVDARDSAIRAPSETHLSAVDRSLAGASQLFTSLESDGDRVGLASIGAAPLWIPPGAGSAHRATVRDALQHDPAFRPGAGGDERFVPRRFVRRLRRRLPSDAQLLVFSPLLDDEAVTVVTQLAAHGYPVTLFSPDPTTFDSVGGSVASHRRSRRIETVRENGLRVIEWSADEPLVHAVTRSAGRWDP